jgi:hypothetical protein
MRTRLEICAISRHAGFRTWRVGARTPARQLAGLVTIRDPLPFTCCTLPRSPGFSVELRVADSAPLSASWLGKVRG